MWLFQLTDAVDASGQHNGSPTDARGLHLRAESGYGWVNKNDGQGWTQIAVAIRHAELHERSEAAAGYSLGEMRDAPGRREARLTQRRKNSK